MNRRNFVKNMSFGAAASLLPSSIMALEINGPKNESLKFGIIADVHKDIMHDADQRLASFIEAASKKNLDFIIQLGDFCRPYDYNKGFMSIWNSYSGKKYHVLGNHDTDGGFTREQVVEYWNAESKYYSFDCKGYHFVILDGNEEDSSPDRPSGYARYLGQEQLNWMTQDLNATELPCIVFCHQGLDNDLGGIHNATESRYVLEQAKDKAGNQKVKLVFSGHHHQDYDNSINGIRYIQINSMSYQWLGEKHLTSRYSEEIDESHPWIKYTVPYKDPIWAFVEIDHQSNFQLKGKETSFVGPSPEELNVKESDFVYPIVARISDRKFKI